MAAARLVAVGLAALERDALAGFAAVLRDAVLGFAAAPRDAVAVFAGERRADVRRRVAAGFWPCSSASTRAESAWMSVRTPLTSSSTRDSSRSRNLPAASASSLAEVERGPAERLRAAGRRGDGGADGLDGLGRALGGLVLFLGVLLVLFRHSGPIVA